MIRIKKFTFNPFQENSYVLINDKNECIVVDPGCFNANEESELSNYIEVEGLTPIYLINTHFHIDHVLGNSFVAEKYNLPVTAFNSEIDMLAMAERSAELYGIPYKSSPKPTHFLVEDDTIDFGSSQLKILFVPGHSPDHIVLVCDAEDFMIGGDVLFKGSIGRTDLPGGNHDDLIDNIERKIFTLKDSIRVYSGHGPETTVGIEKNTNPFFT
ncbi:MBL fold metallo-hydrolase [Vicingaceae bacterium]|nr:MBL fold metallo-hydrolase [Vicingaceae bacterium]MDB4060927.1 MBL fold metallo-hydrolase [Vicingaceae bacterium]MDC1450868.1 MBL fold metallo-hydrolase [Vicingaceae bacterium]